MDKRQAMRFTAIAFFLSVAAAPYLTAAQTNSVSGTAFGTNYAALATTGSIGSITDGEGTLDIGFAGTTNLSLNHDIDGYVIVSNAFSTLSIDAVGGTVTGSQYAVLTVLGGTNLTMTGGQFIGTAGSEGIVLPPVPGQPGQTNTISSAAMGGIIYKTENVSISDTDFSGATYAASETLSQGTDGLRLIDIGSVVISNGTFTGGDGGNAANGTSSGGRALYATNVVSLTVDGGTYTGGAAGLADTSTGGAALHLSDSVAYIDGNGVFTGGNNAAALYARNSDLTIYSGSFQGGAYGTQDYFGLVSIADSGKTNNIDLNGGTFNSIDFAGSGVQLLATGSGLQVDGYVVLDGSSLIVDNASSSAFQDLWVRSGSIQFKNAYSLFSGGNLEIFLASSSNGAPFSADTAIFETNSTIDVDATMTSFNFGTNDVVLVSTENGLSVIDAGGNTNSATDANMAENVNLTATTAGRTILSGVLVDGGTNLIFRFTTETLKDYWNATGAFADFTDELESLMPPEMNTIINLINDPAVSSKAVEQTYFTTFNSYQTALQGIRAAVGQSVARGTQLRDQEQMVPIGARAPMQRSVRKESRMRGWAKYYGNLYTHSEDGLNPSYDSELQGVVLGIDASIGKLIVGISGGSSRYTTTSDNDATENTKANSGSLYGTYGAERGYIDAGIAYGQNKVDTQTADPFRLDGSFDAQLANVYLGGGYNLIDTKGGTVFTPEVSIQYAKYEQDEYAETSTGSAVPRVFDAFDADSLLSTVGMNVSMQSMKVLKTFAFQVDGRLHWMHEFNPDPSNINFRLAGGSNQYQLDYPRLDEEIYRIGFGCSFFNTGRRKPKNVVFRIDFDELFGDGFNSHNLSAKVIYAF